PRDRPVTNLLRPLPKRLTSGWSEGDVVVAQRRTRWATTTFGVRLVRLYGGGRRLGRGERETPRLILGPHGSAVRDQLVERVAHRARRFPAQGVGDRGRTELLARV